MRDVIHCLRGTDFCPSHPFRGTIWGQNYEKNMKTGRKYGEKEKMQILIKSLIFRTLQIYIFSFYAFLFFVSLADLELPINSFQINTPHKAAIIGAPCPSAYEMAVPAFSAAI